MFRLKSHGRNVGQVRTGSNLHLNQEGLELAKDTVDVSKCSTTNQGSNICHNIPNRSVKDKSINGFVKGTRGEEGDDDEGAPDERETRANTLDHYQSILLPHREGIFESHGGLTSW
jgi:hypothetical protein